jgi:hypothetical protein
MSRVTFIENRGKTVFWSAVADELVRRGHVVSWIVQNPLEAPKAEGWQVVTLRFPGAADQRRDAPIPGAVETDRGRTLFGAGKGHYAHYQAEIDRALDALNPDVVIGEAALFHELLTIAACRERSISYVHPTGTRYPGGRIVIFEGDTQTPAAGSGETWPEAQLEAFAEALRTGTTLPDYMRIPGRSAGLLRKAQLLAGQARTLAGRMGGERYNTPSLARKMALAWGLRHNLETWRSLERAPEAGPVILYPLQMQPEANIEVWGRPFHDQVAVIERCLVALPTTGQVAVKANPKAKYEVSEALLQLARSDRRVVLLPLDWRMPQSQAVAIGTVTVTGTVGYEAVFGRGRCISLCHPMITEMFPNLSADTPEEAVERLLSDPVAGMGSPEMTRILLERIIATSFPGVINQPAYDPTCMSEENVTLVSNALERVLYILAHGRSST